MPSWAPAPVAARSVAEAKSAAQRAKSRMFMAPHRYRFYIPRNGPGDLAIRRRCGDLAAFSAPRPGLKSRRVLFATRARAAWDTRSGLCRARPPPLEDERVIEEPDHPGNDRRVGDIEDVPGEAADVEMDEIEHRAVGDAVDGVAEAPPTISPSAAAKSAVRRPPDPQRQGPMRRRPRPRPGPSGRIRCPAGTGHRRCRGSRPRSGRGTASRIGSRTGRSKTKRK